MNMVASATDLIVAIAYFSIPLQIILSLRNYPSISQKTLQLKKLFILMILFAFFIFMCGTGHLLRCLDLSDTRAFEVVNIFTAIISLATALYLVPFVPNLIFTIDKTYTDFKKSNIIISTMYPEPVRERLLNSILLTPDDSLKDEDGVEFAHAGKMLESSSGFELPNIRRRSANTFDLTATSLDGTISDIENHLHDQKQQQDEGQYHKTNMSNKMGIGGGTKDHDEGNQENTSFSNQRQRKLLQRLSSKEMRKKLKDYMKNIQRKHALRLSNKDGSSHLYSSPLDTVSMSQPIADTLPAVSIMFADMVNFTAWSSEQPPIRVFELLERIFCAFDEIALTMGVFKVSTVGDCYIAATGIPEYQEDHATLLALFAEKCRRKMNKIIQSSINEMGKSLNTVSMRFGIHSGPITAGVLRGLKSRFELFGDTINTASRMESTGIPDKIQISEKTASLIRVENGNQMSLVSREDAVHVKGKGVMRTYFLTVTNTSGPVKEGEQYQSNELGSTPVMVI